MHVYTLAYEITEHSFDFFVLAANNLSPSGGACSQHGWSGRQHHCYHPGGGCQ